MNDARNQVRIIGGKWRGRKIDFLPSAALRPTGDKIRETAFNWLQPYIVSSRCLDLFSGSGVFGFEALSRGAQHVVMIDHDSNAITQISNMAKKLNAENYELWQQPIPSKELQQTLTQQKFDIIFLDPPFFSDLVASSCEAILASGCLVPEALVYIETERELDPLPIPSSWNILRAKHAGNVSYYLVQA